MRFSAVSVVAVLAAALIPRPATAMDEKRAGREATRAEAVKLELMKPIALWPGVAPGDKGETGDEKDTSPANEDRNAPSYTVRLGNVSQPTITVDAGRWSLTE